MTVRIILKIIFRINLRIMLGIVCYTTITCFCMTGHKI